MESWVEEGINGILLLSNSSDNDTGNGNSTHHHNTNFFTKWVLNESLTPCPHHTPHALQQLGYPTTAIIYVVFAATCLTFAAVIAFKYNSVKIFNRNIRTQNISNTMWIIYYLTVGIRSSCGAVMYGMNDEPDSTVNQLLFFAALILSSINAFTLSLSLNHQRRFRSSAPPTPPPQQTASGGNTAKEGEPLIVKSEVLRKSVAPSEIVFFVLFVLNLTLLYVARKEDGRGLQVFIFVYLCAFIVQRIPILVLSFIIVTTRNGNEGPTRQSKAYLLFSCLLHMSSDLPVFFWSQILPQGCIIMSSVSYVDVLAIINFASLCLFFLFLRSEYLRNMEECIWTTVSQIQDTFDFRRF